jgi:hypothetical protein
METKFNVSCEEKSVFTPLSLEKFNRRIVGTINGRIESEKKVFLIKYRNCMVGKKKKEKENEDMIVEFLNQERDFYGNPGFKFRRLYKRDAKCPEKRTGDEGRGTAIPSSYNYNWIKEEDIYEFFIKKKKIKEPDSDAYGNELISKGFRLYDILQVIPSDGIQSSPDLQPPPPPHPILNQQMYNDYHTHQATIGGKKKKTVFRRKKQNKKKYTKRRRGK